MINYSGPENSAQPVAKPSPLTRLLNDNKIAAALLDCLRYDGQPPDLNRLAQFSPAEWQALVELAGQQTVGPLLAHRLVNAGAGAIAPIDLRQALRRQYQRNTARNLNLQVELGQLALALRQAGIPVIALKGINLALTVYKNMGLRFMNDIDLLVKPQHLDAARQVLQAIGYSNWREEIPSTSFQHLPPLQKPGTGARVELHWTILPSISPFQVDMDGLWARAKPMPVADFDFEILGLSTEDMLLHLSLHSAYMHRFVQGVRALTDMAEIIRGAQAQLDWALLASRAAQWRCPHAVNMSLLLAHQLLRMPLPANVVATLERLPIEPRLLGYTVNQLIGAESDKVIIARNFAALWADNSLLTKATILARSIFRSKKFIAQMYHVPENSWRVYGYYPVRARDLWLRYSGSAQLMFDDEAGFAMKIELDNTLLDWLETP
jgi:hypothetical protein